jgi:hypothetical protein
MQPLTEVLASWANAAGNNKNVITYKRSLIDHHSKNLELQSHPHAAIYTN